MPSSPEAAVVVEATDYERWEPTNLEATPIRSLTEAESSRGHRSTHRASRTAFARLFPTVTSTQAPEPFAVASSAGIPDAVLADARQAAQSAGYAEGFAHGMAQARARALAEADVERARAELAAERTRAAVARAIGALVAASDELAGRTALTLADVENLVVSSAFDVAEAVVGTIVRDDSRRGAAAVARALALVPDGARELVVRVHPDDHAIVSASAGDDVRFVADPTLAPGDAIAVTDMITVDARLAAGLDRVREVLGR